MKEKEDTRVKPEYDEISINSGLKSFFAKVSAYLPGRIGCRLGHPMLLATLLWSLAHLTANGGAADVLLFGSFALWAAADWVSMRHRKPRAIRRLPATRWNDAASLILGLALYALMVAGGHRWLTGVPL